MGFDESQDELKKEKLYYLVCVFSVVLLVLPPLVVIIATAALKDQVPIIIIYPRNTTTPFPTNISTTPITATSASTVTTSFITTAPPEICSSNEMGYQFTMLYMENNVSSLTHLLEVYPTPRYSASIHVSVKWSKSIDPNGPDHIDFTIFPPDQKIVPVPSALQMSGMEQAMKGIFIEASDKIGVYAMNRHEATCDGFMALPNNLLGYEHYVVCFYPEDKQNQVAFVATEDNTTVVFSLRAKTRPSITIIWKGLYNRSGSNMTFHLAQGEAVHIKAAADLTGCGVFSDNPIAVYAGNDLTRVAENLYSDVDVDFTWAMNYLVEQIPDVSHWGNTFYLVPFLFKFNQSAMSPGYQVKIVCASSDTTITINYLSKTADTHICDDPGDFIKVYVHTYNGLVVKANKPVLVAQLFASDTELSPSMVLITSKEMSNSYYVFPTPRNDSLGSFVHFVQISIQSNATAGLLLDNRPLPNTTIWNTYSDDSGYVWTSFEVSEGVHTLNHIDRAAFGATIIGHSKLPRYCSYAYPAGLCRHT